MNILIIVIAFIYTHYISHVKSLIQIQHTLYGDIYADTNNNIDPSVDFASICHQDTHIPKLNSITSSSLAPNLSSDISASIPPTPQPPSNNPSSGSNLSTQSHVLSASILICLCILLCILCKQLFQWCHIMNILLFTLLLTIPPTP
eukprot:135619_1